jgi:hypothetical protein
MTSLLPENSSHQKLLDVFAKGSHFLLSRTERIAIAQELVRQLAAQIFEFGDKIEETGAPQANLFNRFVEKGYRGTLRHNPAGVN